MSAVRYVMNPIASVVESGSTPPTHDDEELSGEFLIECHFECH